MNADIRAQLELNRKRENKIDTAAAYILGAVSLIGFIGSHWSAYAAGLDLVGILMQGAAFMIFFGFVVLPAFRWGLPRIISRYAPAFIIDTSAPEVVKIYGSIRLDGSDRAEEKLLASRPGLMLYRGEAMLVKTSAAPWRRSQLQRSFWRHGPNCSSTASRSRRTA